MSGAAALGDALIPSETDVCASWLATEESAPEVAGQVAPNPEANNSANPRGTKRPAEGPVPEIEGANMVVPTDANAGGVSVAPESVVPSNATIGLAVPSVCPVQLQVPNVQLPPEGQPGVVPQKLGGPKKRQCPQWTVEEDRVIKEHVAQHGPTKWSQIALNGRVGKQCRERWHNQLNPDIRREPWTDQEDQVILAAHATHGGQCSHIAKLLPGRTDNMIKNRWNSTIKKKALDQSTQINH